MKRGAIKMAKKSLIEAFEIKKAPAKVNNLTDYEIFGDKMLLDNIRKSIIAKLIDANIKNSDYVQKFVVNEIDKNIAEHNLSNIQKEYIINLIDNEINGYGPLTDLLKSNEITEIMVNKSDEVYIEVDGKIYKDENTSFINDDHIIRIIRKIIEPLGKNIDSANPMVDARLEDGSRLNAVIPPLSKKGPVLTIRKFKQSINSINELLRMGTLTPYMARFLDAAIEAKLNILISGGTGSGKTTLLNSLSACISNDERIITIEDAAELKLEQEHVITLETRSSNTEGIGAITIRDLVRNSLRMRPDRIIVGEVRGKEAFDMLQAMNTGHEGSLTTIHANSPVDALNRLETLVLMAGMEIPMKAVREYIANAIDIVVHIDRLSDGRRKITSITEITGIKNDTITTQEIFAFNLKGISDSNEVLGEFILYKYLPSKYQKMKIRGINNLIDIFES
jgi:pilus assembly protein CpaF